MKWIQNWQLDPTVSEGFFGLVVGGFSFVQMTLTPLVGIWADRIEQVRLPLLLCNAFTLVQYYLGRGITV
jgi:hypothetical protein